MKDCKQRINKHFEGRIDDLRKLWSAYTAGEPHEELGELHEYGLCFDYVAPGTFDDQREGYFRYQLSWGGPSDEFRFFVNPDLSAHRIEYWFMDWFDGAHLVCTDDLLNELWDWFRETGAAASALSAAARDEPEGSHRPKARA